MVLIVNGIEQDGADVNVSPISANMITLAPAAIGQGTWAYTIDGTHLYCGYFENTTSADADNFSVEFRVPAGTYTLRVNAPKDDDVGVLDIDLDTVEVDSTDLYAAAADLDFVVQKTGLALTAGVHTFKFRVDGKNGASSDFFFRTSGVFLLRTA